jgi:hypothetical protein
VNPEPQFRDDLDGLTQANLLIPHGSGYRMNALVKQYARELAATPLLRAAQ